MRDHGADPSRRLRSVPEGVAAEPPGPRVGGLDALLREVDGLRSTLEADLSLVAAAVESGQPDLAIEILDGDCDALHTFEDQALGRLAGLAAEPTLEPALELTVEPGAERRSSLWSRLPAAPFVAAAAIVGLLVGVVPRAVSWPQNDVTTTAVSAQSSLEKLTTLAAQGNTSEVRVTAATLHNQISALVQESKDPRAAQQALLLLSYERLAIEQSGRGAVLHDVLAQAAALASRIRGQLPVELRTVVPAAPPVIAPAPPKPSPSPTAHPKKSAKPSPSPTPTPSRSATAKPKPSSSPSTSPKPSPSPSPSASAGNTGASSPYPVPAAPGPLD